MEEVEDARAHHRHHGVDEEVERRDVDALLLIECDGADGLLPHGALVGVSRRLVVVGERNERGDDAEDGDGVDLHVGVGGGEVAVGDGDEAGVLLVDVDVFDDALEVRRGTREKEREGGV